MATAFAQIDQVVHPHRPDASGVTDETGQAEQEPMMRTPRRPLTDSDAPPGTAS
jgi:hypothetical protein